MAKFIYNFEQILNIKQKLEKQEQMNLGHAMTALSGAMQRLDVYEFKHKEAIKDFQKELNIGRIDPNKIKTLNEAIGYYHKEVESQKKIVRQKEEDVEVVKERLKEALRERKTYEILKEKAYEVYLEEEKAAEAKVIDEIVSFKYKDER